MAVFSNQATLYYRNTFTNSNVVTGELTEVLSAAKTAVVGTYTANDVMTYIISLVNTGSVPFQNLTVTDNMGEFGNSVRPLTYVSGSVKLYRNGVLQPDPTVTTESPLVISGISVPAGGNALLIYSASVNQYAPLDDNGTVTNTATIAGPGITTPLTVTETISAAAEAVLTISKAISPSTVSENGQLTYTFIIQNTGNTEATAGDMVIVTDTFNPILNPISVTYNGAQWVSPTNYTYEPTTGLFTTVAGQITVPAATFSQNADTGVVTVTPGVSTLIITGTV